MAPTDQPRGGRFKGDPRPPCWSPPHGAAPRWGRLVAQAPAARAPKIEPQGATRRAEGETVEKGGGFALTIASA